MLEYCFNVPLSILYSDPAVHDYSSLLLENNGSFELEVDFLCLITPRDAEKTT